MKLRTSKSLLIAIALLFFTGSAMAVNWSGNQGFDKGKFPASEVTVDTSNFSLNLDSTDSNVQHALDTLDQLIAGAAESDPLSWSKASDQTLLTGDKSGSFDLTTTGIATVGGLNPALGTGILKHTTTTGVLAIASDGTDYLSSTTGLKLDQTTPQTVTGTPTFPLLITPKIYPSADSTTAVGIFKADGTTNVLNVDTTNGRVGIGTTAPGAKLDVRSADFPVVNIQRNKVSGIGSVYGGAMMELTNDTPSANNGIGFYFKAPDSAGNSTYAGLFGARLSTITDGSEVGDIVFNTAYQGADPGTVAYLATPSLILRAKSNTTSEAYFMGGNVGIGTTAPSEKLDVNGNINIPTTSATVGIIKQNGSAFIHTYAPTGSTGSNLFIGGAGNFTATYASGQDSSLNIGIGNGALPALTTGFRNTVIGRYAGQALTTGSYNNLFGSYAGNVLVDGVSNNFQGWYSGGAVTSGNRNTAVGESANRYNITGSDNTAFGYRSLFGVSTNSYSNNTAIGSNAGYEITTGSSNVFLGFNAGARQTTNSSLLIIDNQDRASAANEATKSLIYGTFNADPASQILTFNANVGIGNTAPGEKLEVTGNIQLTSDGNLIKLGTGEDMTVQYTGTVGRIDTSLVAPSDLQIDCGTDKTLVLDETVWNDSMIPATAFRTGGTGLTLAEFQGNVWMHRFDVGDIFYVQIQLPHDMKTGTTIYPHLHLANKDAIGATGYNVEVTTEHSWANFDAAFAAPTVTSTGLVKSFQNTAAFSHKLLDLATIASGAGKGGISSYVIFKVERITCSTEPIDPAGTVFILGMDIHYEVDTMGSRQLTVK